MLDLVEGVDQIRNKICDVIYKRNVKILPQLTELFQKGNVDNVNVGLFSSLTYCIIHFQN